MSGVRAILGFGRTVADLAATEAFYRDGLGFARIAPPEPVPPADAEAMGLADRRGTQLRMRLGAQTVTFLAVDPPGAPYPADPAATDPFFQHLAIPVRSMASAMAQLAPAGPTPISRGGPQALPAASGGVTAYKFRDPGRAPAGADRLSARSPRPSDGVPRRACSSASTTRRSPSRISTRRSRSSPGPSVSRSRSAA